MDKFQTRIKRKAKKNGRIILANDYGITVKNLESKTIKNIRDFNEYLCGIKLNFHLLLPLGQKEIKNITKTAHDYNLEVIADIKLNDIGNTNIVTLERLWDLGFDAVIANPIMGIDSLKQITLHAHKHKCGVITLYHMSDPSAKLSYELDIKSKKQQKLYQLFLDWAITLNVDGVIAGATYPDIIKYCKQKSKGKLDIYSPGIGIQGGDITKAVTFGSDYLIIGRQIINAKNPKKVIKNLSLGN